MLVLSRRAAHGELSALSLQISASALPLSRADRGERPTLGTYHLYGTHPAELLFTENLSNAELLWGSPNAPFYVKDAFHRRVVQGDTAAVNPALNGSKCTAWSHWTVGPQQHAMVDLVLSAEPLADPFARSERTLSIRQSETTVFYDDLLPEVLFPILIR
ncbi:hypothetical protein [Thiocapsa sp.]|uniref:hypothetical protein n=1 Tax=Thiocapsa sp. TaxID=2024551 RepID=UPI002CB43A57|nr:hypothetical protein [Thiocapsa sp.]HSO82404.1 hypothetical protein [Thiocapsa sp.]